MTVWSLLESFLDTHHLPKMFRMISVGEVETCDVEAFINEDSCVVRVFSFGSDSANCFSTFGGLRELIKEEIGRKRMKELRSSTVWREATSEN